MSNGAKLLKSVRELLPFKLATTREPMSSEIEAGLTDFRLANLTRGARLLIEARKEALAWLDKDPELKSPASAGMKQILRHRWGTTLQLGLIG